MSFLQVQQRVARYIPIHLDSLRLDTVLDFDLFVKLNRQMVLYRSSDLPFGEDARTKLLEHGVTTLYISNESRQAFQKYMERHLPEILSSSEISEEKKALILYDTSKTLIVEVFENPTLAENIKRSEKLVDHTIEYLLQGRQAFLNLLQITSYDYTLYTHSVNVCSYSIALAQRAGISDSESLSELGAGALLHDIGKSRIPSRILFKAGRLTPTEFEIVKKHPQWGLEILRETNAIPENSYYPVIEHHERCDGSGYPNQLTEKDTHIYSRIVAIADSFDAMTTRRAYQSALETFSALKIMNAQKDQYDAELMRHFIQLFGPEDMDKAQVRRPSLS